MVFNAGNLSGHERHAMAIVFSELEGATFNWHTWTWEKQE